MVTQEPHEPTQQSGPISIGQDVFTADGVKVGSIAEIDASGLILARGPLVPPDRLVPRAAIETVYPDGVHLRMTLAQVQSETTSARVSRRGAAGPAEAHERAGTPSGASLGQMPEPAHNPHAGARGSVAEPPPGPGAQRPQVPPVPPPTASQPPPRASRDPRDVDAAAFRENTLRRAASAQPNPAMEQTLELKEERLVAHKEMRQVGEVEVRTIVEQVPARLEVEAYSEEVVVEHVPVGQFVDERVEPWEEDGTLVVPIYEEQLVVVKRLLLKEELRVRRIGSTERRLIEEPVRRERVVVDDPAHTGMVHERFPVEEPEGPALERHEYSASSTEPDEDEGGLGGLLKKMLT